MKLIKWLVATAIAFTPVAQANETPVNELIESLYNRGVIEREEYEKYQESKREERARARIERRERAFREATDREKLAKLESKKVWTDKISMRGYVQFREGMTLGGDDDIKLWNDRSVGDDAGL